MATASTNKPRLNRSRKPAPIGLVHIGPGAFFRAFHAVYTDEIMKMQGGDWGISAVSLKSATARDQLEPQQGCYTAVCHSATERRYQLVDSIVEILVARENPETVLKRMSHPDVQVVTLTVTEKGYCHDPASGKLNRAHVDIVHDLAHPGSPCSVAGYLVEALARRRSAGTPAFTAVSCDNLPANGDLLRRVVIEFAAARDPGLARWIQHNACFPSTMVDRITPATTDKDIEHLCEAMGYHDPACVQHEPFRQWVIEDSFVGRRPPWELAGAQIVESVKCHEDMKLRCLNGTHSSLAYLGYLAGHQTIASVIADPVFLSYCTYLWKDEIAKTVQVPAGENLNHYCAVLLERYSNPSIRHLTWQIASDGSQKLPQRILDTVRDNLLADKVPVGLCLAIAGWMYYVGGKDEQGHTIDVRDPLAAKLRDLTEKAKGSAEIVSALLSIDEIFNADLAANNVFCNTLVAAHQCLGAHGARKSVAHFIEHRELPDLRVAGKR